MVESTETPHPPCLTHHTTGCMTPQDADDPRSRHIDLPPHFPEPASESSGSDVHGIDEWTVAVSLDSLRMSEAEHGESITRNGFRIKEETVEALRNFKVGTLYLVHEVSDDEEAAQAQALVQFILPTFHLHRLVLCETLVGRKAAFRQLDPHVAVDSSLDVAQYLAPVIPYTCLITTSPSVQLTPSKKSKSACTADSLQTYIALLNAHTEA
eukprot:TRINITY_DN33913_c0_g1_i2.p1 TRINITY_DN33913_c0_g1~~TRINITY_DN33913_c0_g1_i2.p1  ORF type:complete len:211 (+),score=48.33 TRINITY_DN33913_c0_g1_i2:72-704(+)